MARYLPDTLDSVAALRAPHEHIVIDGASDDGTVELLEGREDPHLTWISEPDSGQTEAVNKGLRRRRATCSPGSTPMTPTSRRRSTGRSSTSTATPLAGAIFGGVNYVDEHGEVFRTLVPPRFSWRTLPLLRRLRHHADDHLPARAAGPGAVAERGVRRRRRLRLLPAPAPRRAGRPDRGAAAQLPLPPDQQDDHRRLGPAQRGARDPPALGAQPAPARRSCAAGRARRRAILPRISSWPHPEPRGVVKLLRRIGARG